MLVSFYISIFSPLKTNLRIYYLMSTGNPAEKYTCQNCGNSFSGKICNLCGEKVFHEHHLTTKYFFHQVIDFFYHFESKVLKTIKLNFLKPGFVTKENLNGVRVPYANPVQLYLVVNLIFFLVVSKVGVKDYIPTFGDHKYYYLSDYPALKWTSPLDEKVVNAIDSMWTNKGRKIEKELLIEIKAAAEPDGSFKLLGRNKSDSILIAPNKLSVYSFQQMMGIRWNMFNSQVGTYGKTLVFLLLPFFAALFFVFFFKKLKYYGAALTFATHFMVYNLCFYSLRAVIDIWPRQINEHLGGWMMRPFYAVFYNTYTTPVSAFIFGDKFEFFHLVFWMPWLFIAFKTLFNTPWWKNLLAAYLCSKVFYFLIFGLLKKLVIAVTIWSMH